MPRALGIPGSMQVSKEWTNTYRRKSRITTWTPALKCMSSKELDLPNPEKKEIPRTIRKCSYKTNSGAKCSVQN